MKRVAYVGNFEPQWSTENDVRRAFEHLGWDVIQLQEDKVTWQEIAAAGQIADLLLWTSSWDEILPLPEVIDVLRQLAINGTPTATLHLDIFFGSDRGARRWWLNPMFFTGHVFTADGSNNDRWENLGVNHKWLRPAVRHDAAHLGNFRPEYECDVAFVGSCGIGYHEAVWSYRKELIQKLKQMCAKNNWSWKNPGGELDQPNAGKIERGEDMNDFYASAKVTVGDSLCLKGKDTDYCSDRVYEATGRGGLLIMPELNFLKEDFGGELPMYEWGKWDQLENMIKQYLKDETERKRVTQTCFDTTCLNHTYVNRVNELLKEVGM